MIRLFGEQGVSRRKITLKYEGRCLKCHKTIPIGSEAYWESGKGIWHLDCRPSVVQSSRVLNKTVVTLIAVLVVSVSILGYSLGRLGGQWPYQPSITVRVTATVTTSVASETGISTISTETTTWTTPRKWISSDVNVISYLDAKRYIGQVKTVEGKIVRTYRYEPGNVIFLNFHDPYQGYFTVIIWRENWKNFPFAPEVFYKGKEVRVTGLIKDYQGTPQIEATSPKQIEVAFMGFSYPTDITSAPASCILAPAIRRI